MSFYIICVCLCIVVSNAYCVVFLFCFSSYCVPNVAKIYCHTNISYKYYFCITLYYTLSHCYYLAYLVQSMDLFR